MPAPSSRSPTLRDIAARTGDSLMAVSRALRGPRGVTPETRERILKAADEIGYRPNPVLSALAAYRHRIKEPSGYSQIAFVTNFATADEWRKAEWIAPYFEGAKKRGSELGYDIVNFWLREGKMSQQRASDILFSRGIKGLLLAPAPPGRTRAHYRLDWEKFACVALGSWLAKPNLHMVAQDHHFAGLLACHHLRRLGFRRIGFAMWYGSSIRITHTLLDAFWGEQRRYPQTGNIEPFLWDDFKTAGFGAWFEKYRPDVILTNCGGPLSDSIKRLRQVKWRDTPVVYATLNEFDPPEWPGIRGNLARSGEVAMDQLNILLTRGEFGIPEARTCILIEGLWQVPEGFAK